MFFASGRGGDESLATSVSDWLREHYFEAAEVPQEQATKPMPEQDASFWELVFLLIIRGQPEEAAQVMWQLHSGVSGATVDVQPPSSAVLVTCRSPYCRDASPQGNPCSRRRCAALRCVVCACALRWCVPCFLFAQLYQLLKSYPRYQPLGGQSRMQYEREWADWHAVRACVLFLSGVGFCFVLFCFVL